MSPQVAWIGGLAPCCCVQPVKHQGRRDQRLEELQVSWQSEWVQGGPGLWAVGIGSKRCPCPRPALFPVPQDSSQPLLL